MKKTICFLLFALFIEILNSKTFVLWQGFDFKWNRKILGFKTPHRIGSISSFIENTNENDKKNIKMSFTPGVNGDYSNPKTFLNIIQFNPEIVDFEQISVNFSVNDSAKYSGRFYPDAKFSINKTITFNLNKFNNLDIFLNGFEIKMKCISKDCNSNGIWPYKFDINTKLIKKNNVEKSYLFEIEMNRAWTPVLGGGKAFNNEMNYEIVLNIAIIRFFDRLVKVNEVFGKYNSDLHKENQKKITKTIENKLGDSLIGFSSFGFELLKSYFTNKGRYIGEISFKIEDIKTSQNTTNFTVNFNVNSAKWTVFNSRMRYNYGVKVLEVGKELEISQRFKKVEGTICKDDWTTLFFCKFKGLENKLEDNIEISL